MFNFKNKPVPTPPYFFCKRSRQENFRSFSSSIKKLLNNCDGKSNGFTLAEVLITLVIIGVIAALTVPTLMNKTNNQEFVAKLKKTYSTFAQATNLIISNEGLPKDNWATSDEAVYQQYKKYLNNVKECAGGTGCMNQLTDTYRYKNLQGNNISTNWNKQTSNRRFIVGDGVQVMIYGSNAACSLSSNNWADNYCSLIWVDLNGEKKPNTFGRDVFMFALKGDGKLIPGGCDRKEDVCLTVNEKCACKVIREGAMNY